MITSGLTFTKYSAASQGRSAVATAGIVALLGIQGIAPQTNVAAIVEISPMHEARSSHTATTLVDGRVLVVGGITEPSSADMASELFDAATARFSPAGPMITPRKSHSATLLRDGRVLIAGGYDASGAYLRSTELYDPATGKFTLAAPMTVARADHVAVELLDGTILIVGGVGQGWTFLSSAEIYDPVSGRFRTTGSMLVPRESHAVVRLIDGHVLVVGGHRGRRENIEIYSSAEIYDPATSTFRATGEMMIRRHKHDATLLAGGEVLITGGADERDSRGVYKSAEIFDARTNVFRTIGEMNFDRYKHRGTSVMLNDGNILIAGGSSSAELFDASNKSFRNVAGASNMSGQFSATARLHDGRVLITGGYGGSTAAHRGAWLYQLATRE